MAEDRFRGKKRWSFFIIPIFLARTLLIKVTCCLKDEVLSVTIPRYLKETVRFLAPLTYLIPSSKGKSPAKMLN